MIDASIIEYRRRTQATRVSLFAGVGRGRSGRCSCAPPERLPLPSTIRGRRESTRRSLFPGEGRSDGAREQAPVGHAVDPGFRRGAGVGANPLLTPHQTFHRSRGSGSLLTRSEEHTSELQSLMRISYAVFCLKKKKKQKEKNINS